MTTNECAEIIAGLDIGTTKTCCIIGRPAGREIEILGMGSSVTLGVRSGLIVDIYAATSSVCSAVKQANKMAGTAIEHVILSASGSHVYGVDGYADIKIINNEIKKEDVKQVIEVAERSAMIKDRKTLHLLAQEFVIDNKFEVRDPLGMYGRKLSTNIHIISTSAHAIRNAIKCVHLCSLEIRDVVFEQFAAAQSVLRENERDLGVAVINIGAETTSIVIFSNGLVKHTCVLPIGGRYLTNDVSVGLKTSFNDAELIKKKHGFTDIRIIRGFDVMRVPSIMGKSKRMNKRVLGNILKPRTEEMFASIAREISSLNLDRSLISGIVISGGTALMPGITDVAELVTGLPARIGIPENICGLSNLVSSPIYATCIGLLAYEKNRKVKPDADKEKNCSTFRGKVSKLNSSVRYIFKRKKPNTDTSTRGCNGYIWRSSKKRSSN